MSGSAWSEARRLEASRAVSKRQIQGSPAGAAGNEKVCADVAGVQQQQQASRRIAALAEPDAQGAQCPSCQSSCVISAPRAFSQVTSLTPAREARSLEKGFAAEFDVPRAAAARAAGRNPSRSRLALREASSRSRRSRCPGSRHCCCRAACARIRRRPAASARPAKETAWQEIAHLTLAQRVDAGIVGRALHSAIPAQVVADGRRHCSRRLASLCRSS